MNAAIRTYRVPLLFAVLAIAGFLWWSYTVRLNIDEIRRKGQHQVVYGLFNIVEGAMSELYDRGDFQHTGVILEKLVSGSPLRFVCLQKNGRLLFHTSNVLEPLTLPVAEGEHFEENRFLFWRKTDLIKNKGSEADSEVKERDRVLIIGGEFNNDRKEYAAALGRLYFTQVMFFLFLVAGFVAWIMMIRNRLLSEQLIMERQRLAYMEELEFSAAGLAHETKNPLGIISGIAQQVTRDQAIPEESKVKLGQIIDEVDKTSARLGHFLTFARQRSLRVDALQAPDTISRVLAILKTEFDAADVELVLDCPSFCFLADEEMLRHILVNLLMNSLHASPEGTTVKVRMTCHEMQAELIVEDQGCGIASELIPRIYRPYVTGTPDGHGLGLAIVKRYVDEHGWAINIESEQNRGTTVTISGIVRVKDENK